MDEMTPKMIAKKFDVELNGLCGRYFQMAQELRDPQKVGEALAEMLCDLSEWHHDIRLEISVLAGEVGG